MLIIGRRIGESFFIGDDVKMTILEVRGNSVQIGIKAPISISVLREELKNPHIQRDPASYSNERQGREGNNHMRRYGHTPNKPYKQSFTPNTHRGQQDRDSNYDGNSNENYERNERNYNTSQNDGTDTRNRDAWPQRKPRHAVLRRVNRY